MENNITLNEFIENQMTLYNIKKDEKNKIKIYKKCQRTLTDLGFWQSAEIIPVGKTKAKIFTPNQINELKKATSSYFLKLSNYNKAEFDKIKQENWANFEASINDDEHDNKEIEISFTTQIKNSDIFQLMLTTIFEQHFKINYKLWSEDLSFCNKLYSIEDYEEQTEFISSNEYIIRNNRLRNKRSYVSRK